MSKEEYKDAIEVSVIFHEGQRMFAVPKQPAQQEPYGQVTVVRRPGCVDQHWFYRWPELPYLDNAAECHTVYTSPPAQRKPLTDEEIMDLCRSLPTTQYTTAFARAIEAAHGIKEST